MSDDQNQIEDDDPAGAKFIEKWSEENFAAMTPFQRYLHDNGLFDDVIRPELDENDVILEPGDHCEPLGCEFCIGYVKARFSKEVSYCNCPHHKDEKPREVPYDHCADVGCVNCLGVVEDNTVVSWCTCPHHKKDFQGADRTS